MGRMTFKSNSSPASGEPLQTWQDLCSEDSCVGFTLDRIFPPRRTPSKKKDSDVISASSGVSRGSENRRGSPFSLSRLLPSRRRSKSRFSLDSDLPRGEGSASCRQASTPHLVAYAVQSSPHVSFPTPVPAVQHKLGSPIVQVHRSAGTHDDAVPVTEGAGETLFVEKDSVYTQSMSSDTQWNGEEMRIECLVCLQEKAKHCFPDLSTCHHPCCTSCLKEYFKIEIMESRVAIACPECSELFHPNDIYMIVQDKVLMQKYEDFMLRRVLAMDSDTRWCPAPDCGFAVIATGCAGCPKLKCEREGCNTYFCYHCKQYWHPSQTCDEARAERSPNIRSASVSQSQDLTTANEIKSCPRCGAFIMKMDDGSCNHITCAVCGAGFCWLCMQEVSDLHYLSPTGCTFWGRKPWSRKKKILWQLATLVGAPVGITLVAGIAVPAMIIGIPVWVGRKIHYRYEFASKHKRNLAMTGGIAASILAAPVVAGLVVGIGVPVLLAYVYGTVPVSLCRSGGCVMTTTNKGGVRFEFDEDNEANPQGPYSYTGDNHSLETTANVANPSIAPSIGDASLGMTNSLSASGSHMDRAGVIRDDSDRDSASHRAIAGTSISGSLCSATYSAHHHKLGVQADISEAHGERSSVGGESYNISLNDDASTRALAGSIISPKDKDGISLCSRHFDGATAPVACPEEGKEDNVSSRGSSSCPTSPNLRKASPAPSEDTRTARGKKCTRFMDQVAEIEAMNDSVLSGSDLVSKGSDVMAAAPVLSTLSLTTPTTTCSYVLASCESLMSEGRAKILSSPDMCNGSVSLGSGGRLKAESTSVLMDGAERRRCEMAGGARSKKRPEDRHTSDHSLFWSRKAGDGEEHRSQPGNLSDISELTGLAPLHASGCSNLLAVIDTSCESVFLDKGAQGTTATARMPSFSSSTSSIEEPPEYLRHRGSLDPCHKQEGNRVLLCCAERQIGNDSRRSTSDANVVELQAGSTVFSPSPPLSASPSTHSRETTSPGSCDSEHRLAITGGCDLLTDTSTESSGEGSALSTCNLSSAVPKWESSVSRVTIGSDSTCFPSPLPEVEGPQAVSEQELTSGYSSLSSRREQGFLSDRSEYRRRPRQQRGSFTSTPDAKAMVRVQVGFSGEQQVRERLLHNNSNDQVVMRQTEGICEVCLKDNSCGCPISSPSIHCSESCDPETNPSLAHLSLTPTGVDAPCSTTVKLDPTALGERVSIDVQDIGDARPVSVGEGPEHTDSGRLNSMWCNQGGERERRKLSTDL